MNSKKARHSPVFPGRAFRGWNCPAPYRTSKAIWPSPVRPQLAAKVSLAAEVSCTTSRRSVITAWANPKRAGRRGPQGLHSCGKSNPDSSPGKNPLQLGAGDHKGLPSSILTSPLIAKCWSICPQCTWWLILYRCPGG